MKISYQYSTRSEKRGRPRNEDRGWSGEVRLADRGKVYVAAVADGVGGAVNGAEVSSLTLKALLQAIRETRRITFESETRLRAWCDGWAEKLLAAVSKAYPDGGSTLSAVIRTGSKLAVIWVGDSPIYRVDGERVERYYKPHTRFQELIDEGKDEEEIPPRAHSSLTKCIGESMKSGKGLLECCLHSESSPSWLLVGSDGVFNHLDGSELKQIVSAWQKFGAQGIAHGLLAKSLANGTKKSKHLDNATISVLGWNQVRPKYGLPDLWVPWFHYPLERRTQTWCCYAGIGLAVLLLLLLFFVFSSCSHDSIPQGGVSLGGGGGGNISPSAEFNPFPSRYGAPSVAKPKNTPDAARANRFKEEAPDHADSAEDVGNEAVAAPSQDADPIVQDVALTAPAEDSADENAADTSTSQAVREEHEAASEEPQETSPLQEKDGDVSSSDSQVNDPQGGDMEGPSERNSSPEQSDVRSAGKPKNKPKPENKVFANGEDVVPEESADMSESVVEEVSFQAPVVSDQDEAPSVPVEEPAPENADEPSTLQPGQEGISVSGEEVLEAAQELEKGEPQAEADLPQKDESGADHRLEDSVASSLEPSEREASAAEEPQKAMGDSSSGKAAFPAKKTGGRSSRRTQDRSDAPFPQPGEPSFLDDASGGHTGKSPRNKPVFGSRSSPRSE